MPLHEITSLQHPLVKHLVKLRENRDYRYEMRRVVISGLKLIQELSRHFSFQTILCEKGFSLAFSVRAKQSYAVSHPILKKVTGLQAPEPIAAEIEMPASSDLSASQRLLILDQISDPGNLGTLLRSALALGWDGAFLTEGSTDPYNEKALRSAKGATFKLPWRRGTDAELKALLSAKKFTLLAADPKGEELSSHPHPPPLALALGNEAHGLSASLKEAAELICIPMTAEMESLNVASAGAILLYTLVK